MDVIESNNGLSVRAYKGDAMTFLAFDLDESKLKNFVGFSIQIKANKINEKYELDYYLLNKLSFTQNILDKNGIDPYEKMSCLYSPFHKFNWVHVPSTDHNITNPYFGDYTYIISARYLIDGILQPIKAKLTVEVTIDVSPFNMNGTQLGFARAFVSSQAYVRRFGMNNQMRPNNKNLIFNINDISGNIKRYNYTQKKDVAVTYTYEDQHKYLGWQARERVMGFLDEVLSSDELSMEVFAYDLNEPVIVEKLLTIAEKGKLKIILDNAGEHADIDGFECQFEKLFNERSTGESEIKRGKFKALSHSKIFIQKKESQAVKVLTGSANFSTNGLYVNANHVIIFENPDIAALYSNVFADSFGKELMDKFPATKWAIDDQVYSFGDKNVTFRFSPHNKTFATKLFNTISTRINDAKSDVLFAIMQDTSKSSILDAVRNQVQNTQIFSYGITDTISEKNDSVMLYKPNSKRGIRISAKGSKVTNVLPKPFDTVPKIDGYAIHHKFVVVDFKGNDPVVYCGSSNLAFGPEQSNGDNLIEIHDRDIVTAFAIEAFRLTEHFQWRNKENINKEIFLNGNINELWYKKYYNPDDLYYTERKLFIKESQK